MPNKRYIPPHKKLVCPYCGSSDIAVDAFARWDFRSQTWQVASVRPDSLTFCTECGDDFDPAYAWREVEVPARTDHTTNGE